MGILLAVLLITWLLAKSVSDGKLDHTYAKQGLVSPRLAAKYGSEPAARDATDGYGLLGYVRAAWLDYWPRRTAALKAARDAKDADGDGKVSLKERIAAAKAALSGASAKVAETASAVKRTLVDPVPPKSKPAPEAPEPAPTAVDTGDVPDGTIRYTDDGRERYSAAGGEWLPEQETGPADHPANCGAATCRWCDSAYTDSADRDQFDSAVGAWRRRLHADAAPDPHAPRHAAPDTETGGPTMSAPTGEAVNYETTVNELEAIAKEQQGQIDAAQAALKAIAEAKAAITDMQESYRNTATAAQSINDHLGAMSLDAETMGHVGTVGDAMPPNQVDAMFDHLEAMEAEAQQQLQNAEIALASTEAALATVVAKYGDAHATVAGELGGDATFLHSGAPSGTTTGPAPIAEPRNDWHPPTAPQDANSPAQRDQRAADGMRDSRDAGMVGADR